MSRQEKETVVTNTPRNDGPETVTRTVTRERDIAGTPVTGEHQVVQGPVTWEEMRALMAREAPVTVPTRTWRPTTGGILSILAGIWNLIIGLGAVLGGTALNDLLPTFNDLTGGVDPIVYTGSGAFLIVISLISIIGGIMAIRRRMWGLAFLGAILALFPTPLVLPFIMGVFALIFITLGHLEFAGTDKLRAQR